MIGSCLSDMINDHKTQDKWKVHSGNKVIDYQIITRSSTKINFVSSKDFHGICTMKTKSDNMYVMMGDETDKIIKELFKSLLQRYQEALEESMKGSEFVFYSVNLSEYKLNKIGLNRG